MIERLQKIIAASGLTSRRKAEELITKGRVQVNGHPITDLGSKADTTTDTILVDGVALPTVAHSTYLLYKPRGVVTSTVKQHNEQVITDLVPSSPRVYPVGRLDKESEGLILLTNDGDLAQRLTHPSFGHLKTYRVILKPEKERTPLTPAEIEKKLLSGVKLGDGKAKAAHVTARTRTDGAIELTLTLSEGRHHLIRRMCATLGYDVVRLIRTEVGSLTFGKLKPGNYRLLSPREISTLLHETA